jgi:hypothetical protein
MMAAFLYVSKQKWVVLLYSEFAYLLNNKTFSWKRLLNQSDGQWLDAQLLQSSSDFQVNILYISSIYNYL